MVSLSLWVCGLGKQEEPSPKIRFTLDESSESADGANPFVNEEQEDAPAADDEGATSTTSKSKSRATKAPKKSKPSFTVLD